MERLADWDLIETREDGVTLLVNGRHHLRVAALDSGLFRVSLLKDGKWRLDRSWTVAPDGSVPWEGRRRDGNDGFPMCRVAVSESADLTLETTLLRLEVRRPLQFVWSVRQGDVWKPFAEDRPTGALYLGRKDHAVWHNMRRYEGEQVYGLGEKAGVLDRAGRRFEMRNLDALGYDAQDTDPLYKHTPFTITRTRDARYWSIYYDNFANCWFELGKERDNYHKPYRAYRTEDGDLDYYIRWAPDLLSLTKAQVRFTGGTAFPPRWSLGYSGSTMAYTDAPDAQV